MEVLVCRAQDFTCLHAVRRLSRGQSRGIEAIFTISSIAILIAAIAATTFSIGIVVLIVVVFAIVIIIA